MAKSTQHPRVRETGRGSRILDYLPLAVIVAASIATGFAEFAATRGGNIASWMINGMGFFLITLSLLKFFDLPGFADGFQMYDLLARRTRVYAYIYPFIEFSLGLAYVAHFRLSAVFASTIALMVFGVIGVIRGLAKGLDIECACMGTMLHVPLSTVTLTEDLGMAAMAAFIWATMAR
jgi:hypothetical protein